MNIVTNTLEMVAVDFRGALLLDERLIGEPAPAKAIRGISCFVIPLTVRWERDPEKAVGVIDHSFVQLRQRISITAIRQAERFAAQQATDVVRRTCPHALKHGPVMSSQDAEPLIGQVQQALEARLREHAQRFSRIRWVWYLRRLAYVLGWNAGHLRSILPEILASSSTAPETRLSISANCPPFPIDDVVVKRLLGFHALCALFEKVTWCRFVCGLGIPISFVDGLPVARATGSQQRALTVHRSRLVVTEPFPRLGSRVSTHAVPESLELAAAFVAPAVGIHTVQIPTHLLGDGQKKCLPCETHFVAHLIQFGELANFFASAGFTDGWLGKAEADLITLLTVAPVLLLSISGRAQYYRYASGIAHIEQMQQMLEHNRPALAERIAPILNDCELPTNISEAVARLESAPASVRPFIPPPAAVRINSKYVFIDVLSASMRLNHQVQFPGESGRPANYRAQHFEDVVQHSLSASPWRPSAKALQLRKTLTIDGTAITDVDAVGATGDQLLLVSCKSIIATESLTWGHWRTARNVRSNIEQAVRDWETKVARVRDDKGTRNYDLTGFRRIIGVVCTPFPVYVEDDLALRFVAPELRAAVSLNELENWLRRVQT